MSGSSSDDPPIPATPAGDARAWLARLAAGLDARYQVERELGHGGMATVYLARDLKHGRHVAIKVLRPELSAVIGAERFLAEIRTTASLQHPHILGLIDSGRVDLAGTTDGPGVLYYVMPFVDGESLRDRLTREKQLPVGEALRLAGEMASALEFAHRRGIIHRDIKPENILLQDGQALVADFGIALAVSSSGGSRLTETGLSFGTPAYMSPEQATGERQITARSDVYALGAVTYEMLVGEPPFGGPNAQAIIAKALSEDPAPPDQRRRSIPAHVSDALLVALEKLPADRFGSAAELATALNGGTGTLPARRRSSRPSSPRSLVLPGAGAVLAIAGAWYLGHRTAPATRSLPPARLALVTPALQAAQVALGSRQVAITPTGDAVVYVGRRDSTTVFYLQRLDAAAPVEISGSTNLRNPIITPDGQSVIGLSNEGGIRLPLEGGAARKLPLPSTLLNGAWGPDGSYWFNTIGTSSIARLTPTDSAVPAAFPRDRQRHLRIQQVLDDGRTALVLMASPAAAAGPGLLLDLESGVRTPLLDVPVMEMRIVQNELIAVLPSGAITAAPFDARRRRLTGPAVQLASGVVTSTPVVSFEVARNGTIIFIQEGDPSLALLNQAGDPQVLLGNRPAIHAPQFSPDGRYVSFDLADDAGRDVWLLDLTQRVATRATFAGDGHDATWTPDGRFITYLHATGGNAGVYRTRPGSTATPESLFVAEELLYTGTWLPDGSALVTNANDMSGTSSGDIALVGNGGRGPMKPLVASPYLERYGSSSPDGRWVVFTSDQTGREEVYVQPLAEEGGQVQVSRNGGTEPVWAPDSRTVYYRSTASSEVMLTAATLATSPALGVVSQRALFSTASVLGSGPHANWAVSPDGRSFAVIHRSSERHIVVIQDLPGLLRKLRGEVRATP